MTGDYRELLAEAHIASDGWVSIPMPDDGGVHVRVERDSDGRFIVTNVLIHGHRVTADNLRSVQLARLEAAFSELAARQEEANRAGSVKLTGEIMAADALSAGSSDDDLTLKDLRWRRTKGRSVHFRGPGADIGKPIPRPDGTDPDGFYRRVAREYRFAAAQSRSPAAVLAERSSVPVNTVRTWVKEARRRGFLPKGR